MLQHKIDNFYYRLRSSFRTVDCGEMELDYDNINRYRYGLKKYFDQLKEQKNSKIDFSYLNNMKGMGGFYALIPPFSAVLLR